VQLVVLDAADRYSVVLRRRCRSNAWSNRSRWRT